MYRIKSIPEDFIVEEIPNKNWQKEGEFLIIKVVKRNCNTEYVAQKIARMNRIKRSQIKYAGTKDRMGVTTQYMSVKGKNHINIKEDNLEVTSVGFSDEPLSLGTLKGNRFRITVRGLDIGISSDNKQEYFPNFYDSQRFSKNNAEVGLALVKKDFAKACELLKEETSVSEYIGSHPNDHCGAIRTIPEKILLFYVHAYQSRLFNEMLEDLLKGKKAEELVSVKLPLIGFGTDYTPRVRNALRLDGINTRDFIIREIPGITSEGTLRDAVIKVQNLEISKAENDELDENKKKQVITFFLPKGAYATNIIRYLFRNVRAS